MTDGDATDRPIQFANMRIVNGAPARVFSLSNARLKNNPRGRNGEWNGKRNNEWNGDYRRVLQLCRSFGSAEVDVL